MTLQKIVIEVGGKTDLKSTIDQLVKLGVIDENNAKQFLENSKKTQGAVDQNTKKLGVFNKALTNIGPVLAGAFAVGQITAFTKSVVDITAKFQKFEAVLTNTLGSRSEAQVAMQTIKQFAAETPFSVDELTSSFVKLANQGFKPTAEEMRKLGDLAASQGKSFDQLTEAIIDAQTGEFERLKEFGIRASKEGDKVTFTFKGVQKQVDFTAKSIREYVLGLGNANGVMGGMAAIARTIEGQISNLGDSFDALQVALGDRFKGAISSSIAATSDLVQALTEFVEVPVSEKLEDERIGLNVLVGAITNVNDNQEVRNRLIEELQQKYPDFLGNLNAETATNEQLRDRLKEVNQQYVNKIVLQRQDEKLKSQASKQADALERIIEGEKSLQKELLSTGKAYNILQKEGESNIDFAKRLIPELEKLKGTLPTQAANSLSRRLHELTTAQRTYSEETDIYVQLEKEKLELEKRLNIEQEESLENRLKYVKEVTDAIDAAEKEKKAIDDAAHSINAYKEKIKELTEEKEKQTNITDRAKLASLDSEIDKYQKLIKETESWLDSARRVRELRQDPQITSSFELKETVKQTEEEITRIKQQEDAKRHKNNVDAMKAGMKIRQKEVDDAKEKNKQITEDELKEIESRKQAMEISKQFAIDAIIQVTQAVFDASQARIDNEFARLDQETEKEIATLDKRREAGVLSEGKYQAQKEALLKKQQQKELELRRKQAQQEKQAALFTILINTSAAVLKGIAQFGPPPSPAGIAAIAAAIATGGIQAAIVASRPLPAFKEGVVDYKGKGTETSDSNIVRISKGESVITAEATKKYRSELQAMIDGTYSRYTLPVISKKSLSQARNESMAENMANAIMLQGTFNDMGIIAAVRDNKRGKKEDEKLAGMIASKISDRLSENNLFA